MKNRIIRSKGGYSFAEAIKRASRRAAPHCWRFSPRPCVGDHFAVTKMTDADIKNGDKLSFIIGDTYIDHEQMSPQVQWQTIALALRAHGLCIANVSGQPRLTGKETT